MILSLVIGPKLWTPHTHPYPGVIFPQIISPLTKHEVDWLNAFETLCFTDTHRQMQSKKPRPSKLGRGLNINTSVQPLVYMMVYGILRQP